MELLSNNRLLMTTNPEESMELVGKIWEKSYKEVVEGDYKLLWNGCRLGSSRISYLAQGQCAVDFRGENQKVDYFRVFLPIRGCIRHSVMGREFISDQSKIAVHTPRVDAAFRFQRCEMLMLEFPGEVFRKSLPKSLGSRVGAEQLTGSLSGFAGVRTLQSAAAWVAAEASREDSLMNCENTASKHAERMLQALLTDCLREAHEGPAAALISDAQARQAAAWIEAHLSEPITVENVATAIGVSVRSLERSFKQTRGCTPYQVILGMRFERVREALLNADETATVTKVALDHGFFELGRFAVRYRQRFGESPSETLRVSVTRRGRMRPMADCADWPARALA